MKGEKFLVILLISSLIFITPSIHAAEKVTVVPDTVKQTVLQIQTPELILTTDIPAVVEYNISYIDLTTNTSVLVVQDANFLAETKISINKPGMYLIELYSSQLGVVQIKQLGIYPLLLVFIIPLLIVNIIILYQYVRKSFLEY